MLRETINALASHVDAMLKRDMEHEDETYQNGYKDAAGELARMIATIAATLPAEEGKPNG